MLTLEGLNNHLVIIDYEARANEWRRVINIYRSFNPEGATAREAFTKQLDIVKNSFNKNSMLMGDFNLNENRKFDVNFAHAGLFEIFEEKLGQLDMIQMVMFDTWSRAGGNDFRSSLLDHIYVKDTSLIKDINQVKPCFGDHVMVIANIEGKKNAEKQY